MNITIIIAKVKNQIFNQMFHVLLLGRTHKILFYLLLINHNTTSNTIIISALNGLVNMVKISFPITPRIVIEINLEITNTKNNILF